ncbi:MAG: PKD domain-containing protein [Rhodothermales bacterium]
MKKLYTVLSLLMFVFLMAPGAASAQEKQVVQNARHNTSIPLRNMKVARQEGGTFVNRAVKNFLKLGKPSSTAADKFNFTDPVHQSVMGTLAPSIGANFDGSTDADNSSILGFAIVPPDTDGDVGPNHYVQWINSVSEIFDKNGNTLVGPFAGNQYFQGLGGDCESDNSGDPITLYDEEADRWLVSQFAVEASPYFMCIAISVTPDPTGAYHQYAFDFGSDFPDYPKLGIWGDSYTMTTRDFANGASFAGISAVAMDRTAMLNGDPTDMVRFANSFTSIGDGPLPADHDGGASFGTGPAIFGAHGNDSDTEFELWELDVDWSNPNAATFSSITGVTISAYDSVVPSVNQPNGQVLDDLSNFTMNRLNVRDFGTHQSMVATHTVETTANTAGIRWYEFRNTGSGWTLYQEGTYSPDADDRWMGSIAINANGDISLGYSRSSSSMFPSIYMTGQTADQSGTGIMNVAETLLHAGTGSQEAASRWGDYSRMSVDPTDDSFWFTTEYYETTSSFNFKTRISQFVLEANPGAPSASFATSCTLLDCDFTDTSTDSDGSIVSWSWDLGDGNTSTSQNPSNAYAANGTYTVMLTVTDNDGNTASATQSVTVNDGTATMSVADISTTILRGAGSGTVEAVVTIEDQNGMPVAGATVSGTFSEDLSGTDTAVTDANGEAVLVSDNFTIRPSDLGICVDTVTSADFAYDPNGNSDPSYACEGGGGGNILPTAAFSVSTTLLMADFTDASSDSDGSVVSWAWDFGDGNSSTSQNPSNTYAANGTYTVMLTVTDDMGGTGSTSQSVTVNDGTGGGTMHIADISTVLNRGAGSGTVNATFMIVDDSGNPVDAATVSGTFSGDLSGTDTGVTNGSGEAILVSDSFTARPFDLGICADNVTHASLTYDPAQNDDPSFDCSTAAPSAANGSRDVIAAIPTEFNILQNYPNPFNPTTIISYGLPEATQVTVRVYNMLGQVVATLVDGYQAQGRYDVAFNANNLSAGIYLYTIEAADFTATKRMTLLK